MKLGTRILFRDITPAYEGKPQKEVENAGTIIGIDQLGEYEVITPVGVYYFSKETLDNIVIATKEPK